MKVLRSILDEKVEFTIDHLAQYVKDYIHANWETSLETNEQKCKEMFRNQADSAYAFFGNTLLEPVYAEIVKEGFSIQKANLSSSLEHWGPPEERERCLWSVIMRPDGTPLGSLVLRVFHDHTQFRVPYAPDVFGLKETEAIDIRQIISKAPIRVKRDEFLRAFSKNTVSEQRWEYSAEIGLADCLDHEQPERSEAFLDYALSVWGRYNWELTTVVPHQGKLIAFFKREVKEDSE